MDKRSDDNDKQTCDICVESFNKSTRLEIECPYCEYIACRKCCETWILGETSPRCMNTCCGKEWTRQFVVSAFTKSFISTEYKNHREAVLFDQERALLPATQPFVENRIRVDKIEDEIRVQEVELRAIYLRIGALRVERQQTIQVPGIVATRTVFIKACPDPECRGFLSQSWKCGICEKWSCSDCHEVKGLARDCEHTCNPDNVATALLLASDTKSCPSCGTGIHKLEGCDQMFCTMCNTGFSWRTGRIETEIHNPHYLDWLRRTGGNVPRNPNEIQCGREITNAFTRQLMHVLRAKQIKCETALRYCESVIHLRQIDVPRYETNHITRNQELRIGYLRNHITEDNFKIQVQRLDKKQQKSREIHNVLTVLRDTVTDILYRFEYGVRSSDTETDKQTATEILGETGAIIEYANECFRDIASAYGSKCLTVNDTIRLR